EFAAVLPSDLTVGMTAAERVRTAFQAAAAQIAGHDVEVTVSIGAAMATEAPCDFAALLTRADAALYRAKEAGRNRVEASAQTAAEPASDGAARRSDDRPRGGDWAAAMPAMPARGNRRLWRPARRRKPPR